MAVNALLLDPAHPKELTGSEVPAFLDLGSERAGWNVTRAVRFEPGMDGGRWLGELRQQIGDADILVSLGNFLSLYQTGDELPTFLNLISQKMDAGSFTVFDGCSSLTSNAFPDLDSQIRAFLNQRGIRLTPTKVSSKVQDFDMHWSPYSCAFRKVDDCLLDPMLFDGVDAVWAYGNRLVSYAPEVFPLIEASALHFYVDQGDLETSGALGQRNAVAVRSRNLMVLTGSLLADRRATPGGLLPGFDDNKRFAELLIDSLTRSSGPSLLGAAFELFCELERILGQLIEDALTRSSGEKSFIELLPDKMRDKLKVDSGAVDFSKANFLDLVLILRDSWPCFQPLFSAPSQRAVDCGEISKPLFEINEMRKYLAHPHKARRHGHDIAPTDIDRLRRTLQLIKTAAIAVQARPMRR